MKLLQIQNRIGKVKLNDAITPWSADDLIDDIEKTYGNKAVAENLIVGGFQCAAADALETLEIEINSPGGSVLDGYRVYNSLIQMRQRGVEVIATVNNLAASMGSVILMAANKVRIVDNGRIMIHEASQTVAGNSEDHARSAKILNEISDEIATIYAKRTGTTPEEMRGLMRAETWMGAKESIERKFADEIVEFDTKPKDKMSILSKLFPGNDEVSKLEASFAESDNLRAELVASQEKVVELSALASDVAILKADLTVANTAIQAAADKAVEDAAEIEKLKLEVADIDAKVSIKAAELLAAQGHSAPVNLVEGDDSEGKLTKTREQFNALSPKERMQFVKAKGKIS